MDNTTCIGRRAYITLYNIARLLKLVDSSPKNELRLFGPVVLKASDIGLNDILKVHKKDDIYAELNKLRLIIDCMEKTIETLDMARKEIIRYLNTNLPTVPNLDASKDILESPDYTDPRLLAERDYHGYKTIIDGFHNLTRKDLISFINTLIYETEDRVATDWTTNHRSDGYYHLGYYHLKNYFTVDKNEYVQDKLSTSLEQLREAERNLKSTEYTEYGRLVRFVIDSIEEVEGITPHEE